MRTGTVVLIVLVASLSGCSTLTGDTTPTGNQAAPEDGSPAETPDAYPAGYAASGVTDADAAVQAHQDAVLSKRGFSVAYDAVVGTEQGTTDVEYDRRVETASREVLASTNLTGGDAVGTIVRYYANDTIYQKSESTGSDGPRYDNRSTTYELEPFSGTDLIRPLVADVSYGSSEVITYEGDRAVRYGDASLTNSTELLGRDVDPANVTDFTATLVADGEGVVRHVEYEATVQSDGERTISVTVEVVTDDVTVDRPEWVATA